MGANVVLESVADTESKDGTDTVVPGWAPIAETAWHHSLALFLP